MIDSSDSVDGESIGGWLEMAQIMQVIGTTDYGGVGLHHSRTATILAMA